MWLSTTYATNFDPNTAVEVRTRNGENYRGSVGCIDWRQTGSPYDVTEFQVIDSVVVSPEERQALYDASDKISNPKDAVASNKLPLHLVSGLCKAYQAIAHFLGNVKYGAWNYLAGGARASVYKAALDRHMDRWWSGEECDPVDGTPHLANSLACINILIECSHRGNLVDDRPPSTDLAVLYNRFEALMPAIRERYADRTPKHWTIADELETQ